MKISKKVLVPLIVVFVVAAAGGGYYLWQQKSAEKGAKEGGKAAQGPTQYTCPMHPFIIKDKPGSCPICGMTLVPIKKAETGQPQEKEMAMLEHVSLSPSQMVMANVATVKVDRAPLSKEINAVGIVQYDQSRQAKVTAWVAGRIDRLYVDTVGAYVSKGRPVAEVYSPDLVSAQQEYLLALKSREQLKNSPIQSISQGGEGLVSSARQRLKLLGVKDHQIASLEKSGQPNIRLSIYTPLSGIVIEKIALVGQYVNVGDPLFNIADLSTVWVEAEVYESDFPFIKIGQKVSIDSQSYPGKTFTGRVSFIYPFLDPKTRTVKVRVEIANPGLRLKPDMFVNATVQIPLGEVLVVPVAAVMDSGKRQVVWQEMKPGMFAPRDVKVGARVGDNVQILSGLMRGDKVAASGGYLIDSEAQLKGGGGGGHAGHEGMEKEEKGSPAPPTGHEGHAPATPKNGSEMDIDDMKM
ncbi:MAG: efflux RND transporter periplasmic adaptor subunit [Deltaproteobacteria bacterium]|nr:efflux RND transporter periplasmic adaptor subunit [Deltaproteobacteria bacterium]TLN01781.1 MAG: efflux RND transporter periplasmic adaptor subunit [bacterium]